MPPPKRLSVDELLATQQQTGSRATIEAVDGDPDHVTVTPWIQGAGCMCESSLRLPKAAIKSVVPTDERHFCCGKTLTVVEVTFADDSVDLSDLFGQLAQRRPIGLATQFGPMPHVSPNPYPMPSRLPAAGRGPIVMPMQWAHPSRTQECNQAYYECVRICGEIPDTGGIDENPKERCYCYCLQQVHICYGHWPPIC